MRELLIMAAVVGVSFGISRAVSYSLGLDHGAELDRRIQERLVSLDAQGLLRAGVDPNGEP